MFSIPRTRRTLTAILVAGLLLSGVAAAGTVRASLDQRTRAVVKSLGVCVTMVDVFQAYIKIETSAAGRLGSANEAKTACHNAKERIFKTDIAGFSAQAEDAEISVDYYERMLGRVSDYIDNSKPSDLATAKNYIAKAVYYQWKAMRGINQVRAVHGLHKLKV